MTLDTTLNLLSDMLPLITDEISKNGNEIAKKYYAKLNDNDNTPHEKIIIAHHAVVLADSDNNFSDYVWNWLNVANGYVDETEFDRS